MVIRLSYTVIVSVQQNGSNYLKAHNDRWNRSQRITLYGCGRFTFSLSLWPSPSLFSFFLHLIHVHYDSELSLPASLLLCLMIFCSLPNLVRCYPLFFSPMFAAVTPLPFTPSSFATSLSHLFSRAVEVMTGEC